MNTPQAIVPAKEYVDLLKRILEVNEQIIRQNALIVQSVTLPSLIIKGEQQ